MKDVSEQTEAELRYNYRDLTEVIAAQEPTAREYGMKTVPKLGQYYDDLYSVAAEMRKRGLQPIDPRQTSRTRRNPPLSDEGKRVIAEYTAGTSVEMKEHGGPWHKAAKIAVDHLNEDDHYYTKLKEVFPEEAEYASSEVEKIGLRFNPTSAATRRNKKPANSALRCTCDMKFTCDECRGRGVDPSNPSQTCDVCDGAGSYERTCPVHGHGHPDRHNPSSTGANDEDIAYFAELDKEYYETYANDDPVYLPNGDLFPLTDQEDFIEYLVYDYIDLKSRAPNADVHGFILAELKSLGKMASAKVAMHMVRILESPSVTPFLIDEEYQGDYSEFEAVILNKAYHPLSSFFDAIRELKRRYPKNFAIHFKDEISPDNDTSSSGYKAFIDKVVTPIAAMLSVFKRLLVDMDKDAMLQGNAVESPITDAGRKYRLLAQGIRQPRPTVARTLANKIIDDSRVPPFPKFPRHYRNKTYVSKHNKLNVESVEEYNTRVADQQTASKVATSNLMHLLDELDRLSITSDDK